MTLSNSNIGDGISLSVISTNKFKAGALTFSICSPLTERDYLLSLLLAGIMRRGCRDFPSMAAINRRLDMLYAASADIQSVIRGDALCFNVTAELLEPQYSIDRTDISGGVIQTVADIILHPLMCDDKFPEEAVRAEKQLLRDMLASEANDTGIYAATRLKEIMSRGTAFPTLEYMLSAIDSVSSEELAKYHKALLTRPLRIFYVGSEQKEQILEKLARSLAPFASNRSPAPSVLLPQVPSPFVEVTEDRQVSQGKLGLGFRTGAVLGTHTSAVAVMLNEIFGGNPASKLFLGVRERLGLCYYCYSSYSVTSGNIAVASGIEVARRELVRESILEAFEQIKLSRISHTELDAARKSLSFSYTQIYDSPHSLTSFYLLRDLFGISQTVEQCRSEVISVTAEEIAELAGRTVYDTCFFLNGTADTDAEHE